MTRVIVNPTRETNFIILGKPSQLDKIQSEMSLAFNICPDGIGGAIVAWTDARGGTYSDIYAQRVNTTGSTQWALNGVPVSQAMNNQGIARMCYNASVGAIITWQDERNGLGIPDIYAQLIDLDGVAQWTTDGIAVCMASDNQYNPKICCDGKDGAFIAWIDYRGADADIYIQHVPLSISGGIPGFILLYLLVGILAIISIYHRKHPE